MLKKLLNLFTSDDILYLFRLRKLYSLTKILFIKKLTLKLLCRLERKYCCYIPMSAQISNMTTFPHGLYGIFISDGAQIDCGCTIFHQVTIGSNTLADSKSKGAPKIGENVYIGAGSKIIGNISIGDNVRIGANAVVTCNVPDNATVVMEHPRIIMHKKTRTNLHIPFSQKAERNDASI